MAVGLGFALPVDHLGQRDPLRSMQKLQGGVRSAVRAHPHFLALGAGDPDDGADALNLAVPAVVVFDGLHLFSRYLLPGGGVVVSNEIELLLDVEAILLDDLERTGAIEFYRD